MQLPELANIPPLDVAAACAKVSAHNAKARASLMEAEPILRDAQAKGYLEELAKVRSRLDRAESRS